MVFATKPTSRIVFGLPYISVCQVPWKCNTVMLSICFSQLLFIFIYFDVYLYCNGLNSDHSEAAEVLLFLLNQIWYNILALCIFTLSYICCLLAKSSAVYKALKLHLSLWLRYMTFSCQLLWFPLPQHSPFPPPHFS